MLRQAFLFLRHWLTAQSRYAVHSPFVYEFVTQVLPHEASEIGGRIEEKRRELAKSRRQIEIRDHGAGYGGATEPIIHKEMREVVASSARKRRSGELLHRICKHYKPQIALEFGTNLGFSTLYQASAFPTGRFISMEGAPELAKVAGENFEEFGQEIDVRVGEFSESMEKILQEDINFDYVLLDGNHTYAATVAYFDLLENRMAPDSILIVDDINWSQGMREAWEQIRQKESVSVSVDLYWMGLCFMHRSQAKEAFRFRFRP